MTIRLPACYAIFHLNLEYSSIDRDRIPEVIERCYSPLLDLVEHRVRLGIEVSGATLERIRELDGNWVERFGRLCEEGRCELIGSGYSQIIGPLVPSEINQWNLQFGNEVYESVLGVRPEVALINEMAFSEGLCEHYLAAGYSAIVMEWNNPRISHPSWPARWRYFPQRSGSGELPVIWADSILFQKFQRCAHGEITPAEYAAYIENLGAPTDGYLPVYASDVEVFGFRPGRYRSEGQLAGDEWQRIESLVEALGGDAAFLLPSSVLEGLSSADAGHRVELASPAQPIPVKKQEKYNLYRWALTGRGDLEINTRCHRALQALLAADSDAPPLRRELCRLWSSDARTHLTDKRWAEYLADLSRLERRLPARISRLAGRREPVQLPFERAGFRAYVNGGRLHVESPGIRSRLDPRKGLAIEELIIRSAGSGSLLGTLSHGHFDDIRLGADFYSGHFVIEKLGAHKIAGLAAAKPSFEWGPDGLVITHRSVREGIEAREVIRVGECDIEVGKTIRFASRTQQIVHPLVFTLDPGVWDRRTLRIETHNGGRLETFRLGADEIRHDNIYSALVSARHGFGATDGRFTVRDRSKRLCFEHDATVGAVIPSIVFIPTADSFLFRLRYSAQEVDETFRADDAPATIRCSVRISGSEIGAVEARSVRDRSGHRFEHTAAKRGCVGGQRRIAMGPVVLSGRERSA